MRIYRYNTVSGLYEGADFCDDRELNENNGITTLAPPSVVPGYVPVFDAEQCNWKQVALKVFERADHA